MHLEHICDLEIVFERFAFAHADVADTNWICYADWSGTATGGRVEGSVRWSNRARWRDDDVGLPRFDGVIDTDDGAEILWSFRGYNSSSHLDPGTGAGDGWTARYSCCRRILATPG